MSHASHPVTGPQHWFWGRKARREAIHSPLDGGPLAQAIVDTVREPLLVLDKDLRVIAASRSFYKTFAVSPKHTQGQLLASLGDGQWDIPNLRDRLERIVPEHGVMEEYEVEQDFPVIGRRIMLLKLERSSTTTTTTRPSCLLSRMSPSVAPPSIRHASCCSRKISS